MGLRGFDNTSVVRVIEQHVILDLVHVRETKLAIRALVHDIVILHSESVQPLVP